jgi:hypothetical protein
LFVFASAWGYAQTSIADEAAPQHNQSASSSDWIVSLGAWGGISPDHLRFSHYEFDGWPIVDVRRWGSTGTCAIDAISNRSSHILPDTT